MTKFSFAVYYSMEADRLTPRSQGVNALKIWMLGCTMMIIAALSEYGIILFMKCKSQHNLKFLSSVTCVNKTKDDIKESSKNDEKCYQNIVMLEEKDSFNKTKHLFVQEIEKRRLINKTNRIDETLRKLDFISLILFPIVFVIFIIIYWLSFSTKFH